MKAYLLVRVTESEHVTLGVTFDEQYATDLARLTKSEVRTTYLYTPDDPPVTVNYYQGVACISWHGGVVYRHINKKRRDLIPKSEAASLLASLPKVMRTDLKRQYVYDSDAEHPRGKPLVVIVETDTPSECAKLLSDVVAAERALRLKRSDEQTAHPGTIGTVTICGTGESSNHPVPNNERSTRDVRG